jgi:hypothetical protein
MEYSTFDIYSKNQTVEIIPSEIRGSFDGLSSYLEVFPHFTYRGTERKWYDLLCGI